MEEVSWKQEQMLEVSLNEPDDFLKVRETLSRIGVASRKEKKLYQSCHILHKQGKYYIVHFKELFALDGKDTNLSENDIQAYNNALETDINSAKLTLKGIQAQYTSNNVTNEPNLTQGQNTSGRADIFNSTAEIVNAINDKRYAEDSHYRNQVEEKIKRSKVL